ncbi:MAG: FMN-binding protein, partial [Firmicutes bacterium]|nr:FMN-binding protein [Bacillota bacterium]
AELEEAVQAFEITVDDGTYRGVGQGFGGDLVVDVTVSEGRISEIVVVEHGETPFVADPALKKLIPAIIERQGPVDAVSGATMTSKGLEEALRSALNGKEGQ